MTKYEDDNGKKDSYKDDDDKKKKSDKVCEDAAAAHKLAFIAQRTGSGGKGRLWSMCPFSSSYPFFLKSFEESNYSNWLLKLKINQ